MPQADLDDLLCRLHATRFPADLANDDWGYGVEGTYLRELMTCWAEEFDWRAQECAMNAYDHFLVEIGRQPTHYLHVRRAGALPVLLIHGWPQTFWDFAEVLPMLDEFELVVPDLPGHGFSTPLMRTGVGFAQASDMYHHLMTEVLGHRRYAVYGTDWGACIGEHLALTHPDEVLGLHTTMPIPLDFSPRNRDRGALWAPEEHRRRKAAQAQAENGSGYLLMQIHRPQTVAYLGDSPLAMAAWLVDKVHAWTDHDGNVEAAYPRDRLLTTLTLYWFTNTLGTAARFYAESLRNPWQPAFDRRPMITVPTAVAAYPNESGAYPKRWVEQYFNLERYTVMDRGGHFPAVENPKSLGADIAAFFRSLRTASRPTTSSSRLGTSMPLSGTYEPSSSEFTRNQVELYEQSGGREGATVGGAAVVVLTTLGAKSGKLRKTAVMRVEHEGVYVAVASLAGAPRHPSWYLNLRAHPEADLQDGPVTYSMVAREAFGNERDLWWARAVAAWPEYEDYQAKTKRIIPLMVLEPETRGSAT